MLGFLSRRGGTDHPACSYVNFRPGNASPQVDILEAIEHTRALLPEGKRIQYFRSDSAAYQADIIDYCNDHDIYYTITADQDVSVKGAIRGIPSRGWKTLHDRQDGFKIDREYSETVHTMNKNKDSFRLIDESNLFDGYGRYKFRCIITNIPEEEMTGEEVIWHHNSRGNAERFIEDMKYGINLRFVPCGQFAANAMYCHTGILVYNLIKLMQLLVLPHGWSTRTIQSLRDGLFRMPARRSGGVGKVTTGGHRIWL